MRKIIPSLIIVFILISSISISYTNYVFADPTETQYAKDEAEKEKKKKEEEAIKNRVEDFIISQELMSPVMDIILTDGSILFTTPEEKKKRIEINSSLLQQTLNNYSNSDSDSSGEPKYSLYDRFGPKLQFVQYLGEVSENIELADHLVSAAAGEKLDQIKITDDILRYKSSTYLSTRVYKNRPLVLNSTMTDQGYMDSRVKAYEHTPGLFLLVHSRFMLSMSSFIYGVIDFFKDNKFLILILDSFKYLVSSSLWGAVDAGVSFILWIFLTAFIISLVKHAISYAKGKNGSVRQFLIRTITGIFALGIVFSFLSSPVTTIGLAENAISVADNLLNESMSKTHKNDPIVYSENGDFGMSAVLWKTTLFEPWCKAMFGKPYEKLYTQYAEVDDSKKLKQDFEPDHDNPKNADEEDMFYDSAGCTGDVFVDLGNGVLERNWAAYALSTMSKFHFGHEIYEEQKDTSNMKSFPVANTTGRNKNLYADTFRWIDAKMNISPQYSTNEEKVEFLNYGNSRDFETHYYKYSWDMFWMALLLLGLAPVIFLRIKAFMNLALLSLKGIIYGLKELIKENTGLSVLWSDFKESFILYIYHSLQLYILIYIYEILAGSGNALFQFGYIILCFLITSTTPWDIVRSIKNTKEKGKRFLGINR